MGTEVLFTLLFHERLIHLMNIFYCLVTNKSAKQGLFLFCVRNLWQIELLPDPDSTAAAGLLC